MMSVHHSRPRVTLTTRSAHLVFGVAVAMVALVSSGVHAGMAGAAPSNHRASVALGWKPSSLAIAPDGSRVYAGSYGFLHLLKASTMKELGAFPVGTGWIRDLAVDRSGGTVYLTSDDNMFYAVSPKIAKPVWSVPVGQGPKGFALTPDQTRAYVANFNSGTISVVDLVAHRVIGTIPVGQYPWDVSINPDGSRAYAAMRTGTTFPIIDTARNAVIQNFEVGSPTSSIAVSVDGQRIYLGTDGIDGLTVVNVKTGGVEAVVPLGKELTSIVTSLFGQVFARDKKSSRIFEVSTITLETKAMNTSSQSRPTDPEQMILSPDSRTLYFTKFPEQSIGTLRVPYAPPGIPQGVRVSARPGLAYVSWSPPKTTGTSRVVLEYEVSSRPGERSCKTKGRACTVTGLASGTQVRLAVRARSAVGWGRWAVTDPVYIPVRKVTTVTVG